MTNGGQFEDTLYDTHLKKWWQGRVKKLWFTRHAHYSSFTIVSSIWHMILNQGSVTIQMVTVVLSRLHICTMELHMWTVQPETAVGCPASVAIVLPELISTFIYYKRLVFDATLHQQHREILASWLYRLHFSLLPWSVLWPFPCKRCALHGATNKRESQRGDGNDVAFVVSNSLHCSGSVWNP